MKKLLIVGLLLGFQSNLMAFSGDVFKRDSNHFCDVFTFNNNLDSSLDSQFMFESCKLVKAIESIVLSIDEISLIQKKVSSTLTFEQSVAINYHIINLNIIRKTLMHIKNNYQLSHAMHAFIDCYRNSIDSYYHQLNPSYKSYLLKQCNVSMKEITCASLYTITSIPLLMVGTKGVFIGYSYYQCEAQSQILAVGILSGSLGVYLSYCAYMSIHDPSYEFDLIAGK